MTVLFSKKCELALQAVLFLSYQDNNKVFRSGDIAKQIKAPKEFVSKVLQTLTLQGIVGSKKGKSGGFFLQKKTTDIKLFDIVQAIDGNEIFERCLIGFPGCSPENPCPVHHEWKILRENAVEMLSQHSIEEFKDISMRKIESLN